jgi:hypothetical protein
MEVVREDKGPERTVKISIAKPLDETEFLTFYR